MIQVVTVQDRTISKDCKTKDVDVALYIEMNGAHHCQTILTMKASLSVTRG